MLRVRTHRLALIWPLSIRQEELPSRNNATQNGLHNTTHPWPVLCRGVRATLPFINWCARVAIEGIKVFPSNAIPFSALGGPSQSAGQPTPRVHRLKRYRQFCVWLANKLETSLLPFGRNWRAKSITNHYRRAVPNWTTRRDQSRSFARAHTQGQT